VVPEHALHDRLAVVKTAIHRERMHVIVGDRGHHAPLHFGDAPLREQHEDVGMLASAERLDRGGARISGSRDHNRCALAAGGEHMVHQASKELQGHVLEGEGGPVEELEHELAHAVLSQRGDCRMPEIAVGFTRNPGEVMLGMVSAAMRGHSSGT
jgi:hypothetical protein